MLFVASIVQVNQKDQQLAMEGYYRSAWRDRTKMWEDVGMVWNGGRGEHMNTTRKLLNNQ